MSSPVYRPASNPSDLVLEEEAKIIEAEGRFHVNGLYFANQSDAAIQRRWEAEKRVREAARLEKLTCAFCGEEILSQIAVIIAMQPVHPKCAREFDAWIDSKSSESDPRWAAVTSSTAVLFDGEMTTFGSLSGNEKMSLEFDVDGKLVGGSPF